MNMNKLIKYNLEIMTLLKEGEATDIQYIKHIFDTTSISLVEHDHY